MPNQIYLSPPHLGGNEINFINQAMKENWIAPLGPNVDAFEQDICHFTEAKYCTALSSGTAAIHLALIILGIDQGDEVLVPTFTFSATINPIIYQKALPIFIESESDTWNMSPLHLEEAIKDRISKGKKPKAIIPVHIYGMPAKMNEILAIANDYQIPIIEDAAEALGSTYCKQKLGTIGHIGILSFNGNKIITTSGGGVLISNHKDFVDRARHLATQARENAPHYEHNQIGYNYRMSNICAGIGRGQMEVLDNRVSTRRKIFKKYKNELKVVDAISFLEEPSSDFFSNHWLTTILLNPKLGNGVTREDIRMTLEEQNVESRPLWKPMHLQPVFKDLPYYGDRLSEKLFEIGLCLPSGSNLTDEQQSYIISIIKSLY